MIPGGKDVQTVSMKDSERRSVAALSTLISTFTGQINYLPMSKILQGMIVAFRGAKGDCRKEPIASRLAIIGIAGR
jgi:hypothetical protein